MKKWVVLLAFILIVLINPSKMNVFNNTYGDGKDVKKIKDIEVKGEIKYIEYGDNLIVNESGKIMSINPKGEVEFTIESSKTIDSISSNKYIDVLDKKGERVYSIKKDGKAMFGNKVFQDVRIYRSINADCFVTGYKKENKENKEYIKIENIEGSLIKEIELKGKITHVEPVDKDILVVSLSTDEKIQSEVTLYDSNGNLKNNKQVEDIIIDIIYENNTIYLILENKILVLDNKLNIKSDIEIEGIKTFTKGNDGNVYIIDKNNKMYYIEEGKSKSIRNKSDIIGVKGIGDSYITYSENSIYDKKNKELIKFGEKIKDIVSINKNVIGVIFDESIEILSIGK